MHLTLVGGGVFRNEPEVLRTALSEFEKLVTNERVRVYIHAYDLGRAHSQLGSLNSYPIMTSAQFLKSTCFNVAQLRAAQRAPEVQTAHREQALPPPAHSATPAARYHPPSEAPSSPQGSQREQFQAPPAATAGAPVAASLAAPDASASASSRSELHQNVGESIQHQQQHQQQQLEEKEEEEGERDVICQTAHAGLMQRAQSAASQPQLPTPNLLRYKETFF